MNNIATLEVALVGVLGVAAAVKRAAAINGGIRTRG